MDDGTLAASGGTDQSNICPGLHNEVHVAEDTDAGTSGVPEVDVLETDMAASGCRVDLGTFSGLRVDFRNLIEKSDDVVCGSLIRM